MTPIRHLDGITYWVIDSQADIGRFVTSVVKKEWERDLRSEGRDPAISTWLADLLKRRWELRIIKINKVKPESDYISSERLKERTAELRRTIEEYGSVIWPIVVKSERYLLADGYCRYATLMEMGVSRVYAYVGSLLGQSKL